MGHFRVSLVRALFSGGLFWCSSDACAGTSRRHCLAHCSELRRWRCLVRFWNAGCSLSSSALCSTCCFTRRFRTRCARPRAPFTHCVAHRVDVPGSALPLSGAAALQYVCSCCTRAAVRLQARAVRPSSNDPSLTLSARQTQIRGPHAAVPRCCVACCCVACCQGRHDVGSILELPGARFVRAQHTLGLTCSCV